MLLFSSKNEAAAGSGRCLLSRSATEPAGLVRKCRQPEKFNPSRISKKLASLQTTFVIQDKASFYLVQLLPLPGNHFLALFELLAFRPQFQSSYLKEFQRLSSVNRTGADIDFWEFTHETDALDNLFSRSHDEYFSQQREERESRTLYFPLRNERGQILATVTLNSLRLQQRIMASEQWPKLLALIFLAAAVIFFFPGRSRNPLIIIG
jgi:hypothetical protein